MNTTSSRIVAQIARTSRIFFEVAAATYKEWAAYRSHAMVSLFVGPVYFAVQYFIWSAVYSTQTSVNGFTLDDMLAYFGIAALIYYLIFDFADWNLGMLVHTGQFLTFMIRPMSHRFYAFSQKAGHRVLGFWVEFLPVYLIFTFIFQIKLAPKYPLWAVLSIMLGFTMMFLINYCAGILAFWFTKTGGISRMFVLLRDVFAGSLIPLTFFPDLFQQILFVLPFQFAAYVPVRVFIGSYDLAGFHFTIPQIVGLQAIAVVAMLGVSELLWRLAIRKFTGVGA